MKNQNQIKRRSDRPSGRQASEQPEHSTAASTAPESLHQGQGPDFISQDKRLEGKNEGVMQTKKKLRNQHFGKRNLQDGDVE